MQYSGRGAGPAAPAIVVYRLPGGRLVLVDGWHRLAAAERLALDELLAIMREGDYTVGCDEAASALASAWSLSGVD